MSTREEKLWKHFLEEKQRRATDPQTKKGQKPQRIRRRDWTTTYLEEPDGYDDLDVPDRERVMPKGETEWRQARVIRSPLHGGIGAESAPGRTPEAGSGALEESRGTVVEIGSDICRVLAGERALLCTLRSSLRLPHSGYTNMVAVGDQVVVSHNGHDRGTVEAILPRRSALSRPDVFLPFRQQIIVANVDQVLIVSAWREPAFWPELVDRFLIAALRHNLEPIVCVNKIDLAAPGEPETILSAYRGAGHRMMVTSAVTGAGLDELKSLLEGKTTVLAGLSGVGKSSLLSAVEPGLDLRVSEVSDRHHEGRHTTTQVTLHPLLGGGLVADTPGIRDFALAGLRRPELRRFYPEFAAAGTCTYTNCSHTREPGCAVRTALQAGRLSEVRYDSYRKIWRELPE